MTRSRNRRHLNRRWPAIVFIVLALFLISFIGLKMATLDTEMAFVQTYALPEFPELTDLSTTGGRQWAVAVDGVVMAQGGDTQPQPTASTTKMILALAIMQKRPFEKGELGETITITQDYYDEYVWQISHGGSNTLVRVGETISEYDALASVLIASSNNMADSLAKWAFGSQEEYQKYAKQMLEDIGVKDTIIGEDASGYDESTVSTATDLAIIAEQVLRQPVLAEIVAKEQATVPVAGTLTNTNKLLGKHNIIGVKTGYIGAPSGYCLVTGYLEDGHIITVALLGATTRAESFDLSEEIVAKLQAQLTTTTLVAENAEIGYYETWWNGRHSILAKNTLVGLGWKDAKTSTDIAEDALQIKIANQAYTTELSEPDFERTPNFWQRLRRVFGWEFQP